VSLKVLGYSLEEISVMLKMPSLNVSLKETLEQQRKAFEEKRKHPLQRESPKEVTKTCASLSQSRWNVYRSSGLKPSI